MEFFITISSQSKIYNCIIISKRKGRGMKKWYALIFSLCALELCAREQREEWINIFVHGAVSLRSHLSLKLTGPLLHDKIEGTSYEKDVVKIRRNKYLFTMQAIQDLGLQRINSSISTPPGAYAFATLFDTVLKQCQGPRIKNWYYTFGWTGLVSYKRRYFEARILYNQIKEELAKFHAQGRYPKVRILGYSHGANVVLNLTAIRHNEFPHDSFCIEEAILLGAPVSVRSMKLIEFPFFKNIYHLYSKSDLVQLLDITVPGHRPVRTFANICLPERLTQIEVKLFGQPLEGPCKRSLRKKVINQSPGHFEFWFFGWALQNYRRNLSIYPLPFGVLAPLFVCAAHAHPHCSRHMVVDVRLEDECIFVSDSCSGIKIKLPFMSRQEFVALQKKALSFHPSNPRYRDAYRQLQSATDPNAYK